MLKLAKLDGAGYDANTLEVLSSLQYNLLGEEASVSQDKKFIEDAKEIIELACGKESVLSDDAAGVCAIMCQNGESAENIKVALKLCTTNDGKVDTKLSEVFWNMGVQRASLDEIQKVFGVCKNQDNTVNHNNADMIISLFDSGYSKDKILALIK